MSSLRSTSLGTAVLSFAIVFAFAGVLASNLSWAVLSVVFAVAYVYAHLRFVSELQRTNLQIDRTVVDSMPFANEPINVVVEVLNKDPITVRGTYEDVIPENCELAGGTNRSIKALPPRSILRLSYSIMPRKRGPLLMPGMRIDRNDVLGLFEEEQFIERATTVNVHTDKGSFETARNIAGREHLEFSGMGRAPAIVLRELEFDGIRDYVPGDRARDIHWKLLPKVGKLMTKIYRKEGSLQTTVFVDCSRSMRLKQTRIAKIDHAIDLSMQLSNVLLSSYYSAGAAIFDETQILGKVRPMLGKRQFERIVKLLREAPPSIEYTRGEVEPSEQSGGISEPRTNRSLSGQTAEGKQFLSTLGEMTARVTGLRLGFGLEGAMKDIIAHSKGQEQLFVVISDLLSTRDAAIAGAKVCQSTHNKMLVINTYDDWYRKTGEEPDMPEIERLYADLSGSLKNEAILRGLGASYIRIGPADSIARIVRAIRRGEA